MLMKFENEEYKLEKRGDQIYMSLEDLSVAIGYAQGVNLKRFLESNSYLLTPEFSVLLVVDNLEGGVVKRREKRFFNEQGIYEVSLLANTKKAKEFRRFARHLLTSYRKGEIQPLKSAGVMVVERKIEVLESKIDEMIEVVKNTESIVESSEIAEESFRNAIARVDLKLEKLEALERNFEFMKELYEKMRCIINEHDNRICDLEEKMEEMGN